MSKIAIAALMLALCPSGQAAADEISNGDARAKVVAPFVDDETIAVGRVDMMSEDVAKILDLAAGLVAPFETEVEGKKQDVRKWLKGFTEAGGREIYFVYGMPEFPRHPPILIVPIGAAADEEKLMELLKKTGMEAAQKFQGVVGAGADADLKRLRDFKPKARPELAKGFAAAGTATVQIVVMPSADTRRVIEETIPDVPKELGGGSIKVVTRGVMWAALGGNGLPRMSLNIVAQSQDNETAEKLKEFFASFLGFLGKQERVTEVFPNFGELASKFQLEVEASRLTLKVDDKAFDSLLIPALNKVRAQSTMMSSVNSLKQIALAMHYYHDVYKNFPKAANYDKQGRPLLSWRVHILPFVEQNNLYKQFHLDEPWDTEHNKKLITSMPQVYRSSAKLAAVGKTTFLGVAGKAAMFPGNQALSIRDVKDGTANTAFVVDADDSLGVEWTKPQDFDYDPKNPGAGLGQRFKGKILFALVDGSVRVLSAKISATTLNAFFTRAGGEVLGNDF